MTEYVKLTREELDGMLERAASAGANIALARVGMHDETAGKDMADLRTLIDGWRQVKRTVLKTVLHWVTMGILSLLLAGAYTHFKK